MKTFLLLLLITITGYTAGATDYYFSNTGSDANNGTSAATPWQTLAKFNAVFASKSAGDNFLFNRGEVFYGNLVTSRSGTAGSPITIGAYGAGANPIITGFSPVTAWTNLGANIWESTNAVSTLAACNIVTVNGANTAMGRYPNTGFLVYQSHAATTSITSSSLTGSQNWTGAQVVMRSIRWMLERNTITSQTGTTLNYTGGSSAGTNGYGFFIQNDVKTLDAQNEWYFNPSTKKIRMYSTVSPANIQVPTIDELVLNSGSNYITYDHIDFKGANSYLLEIKSSKYIIIQNCGFFLAGKTAVYNNGAASSNEIVTVANNIFSDNNDAAINFTSYSSNAWVKNNTITNTGIIPGAFATSQYGGDALTVIGPGSIAEYNTVTNSGHTAIATRQNDNLIVRYNRISNFGMTRYDAGAIYSWNQDSTRTPTGRFFDHNIISDSRQTAEGIGTDDVSLFGIYLDGSSKNTYITNNTISNCVTTGILILNTGTVTITGNTCYNNGSTSNAAASQLLFHEDLSPSMHIQGMIVKNNIFFSKARTQPAFTFRNDNSSFTTFGTADSNYYARPIDNNLTIQTAIAYTNTNRTLAGWQTLSGQDVHSTKLAKTITDTSDLRFEYNATTSAKTVSLPYNYLDAKNIAYNGTITLAPYTGAVLIKNGAITGNKLPVTNAGADQTMTLPTNNASLTGNATDSDGTIASYTWTKISGPASGTITNATSAATTLTALTQGVYQFRLTATDNNAATSSDTINVTVNAAANIAPTANAGADQTMTLPTNNASLTGNATDSDGTIESYTWTKISGPASGTITNATSAATTLTALTQGVYQFQLTATDNNAATTSDTMKITVNAANIAPTANAGADQTMTLPTNNASLTGNATDSDGTIASYAWTKISGPAAGTITNATSAATTLTALTQGVYQFRLTATDNNAGTSSDTINITVNAAANIAPTANAGADQTITLPTNNVSLTGNGADSDGTIAGYAWAKISGPASGTITNATSAATTLTALTQGVYQFRLTATDNNAATSSDTINITVNAAANIAPTANAGADQTITLPTNSVSLTGNGADSDGTIASYAWTITSGPAGTITNPTSAAASLTGLTQGVYQLQLQVTDNSGAVGMDNIQVTVDSASNLLPAVNPANTVKGLNYKYYEATSYSAVPAFYTLTPVKTGTTANIDITLAKRTTAYAFNFTGFISVPTDGQYTFYTTSDDGSTLYIDNVAVVNNDGLHGSIERSGIIGLKAGKHAISVGYFQQGGGNVLAVSYASAGIAKQAVPNSAMYRVSTARRLSVDAPGTDLISAPEVVVKAYPNPFIDHIEININGGVAGDYKLMLVDAAGKIIWIAGGVKNAGSFQQSVNTSNLARGIYFLRVVQNNTTSVIKLVK